MKLMTLGFLLITYSTNLMAARIGNAASGGTGCPVNSSEVNYDEELGLVTVNTPSMYSSVGDALGKTMERLSCSLALPIQVEDDEQVVIYEFHSHDGYVRLAPNTSVVLSTEVFFAGEVGEKLTYEIESQDSPIRSKLEVEKKGIVAQSLCGADVNVRVNSSLRLKTESTSTSKAKVGGYSFFISIEKCN